MSEHHAELETSEGAGGLRIAFAMEDEYPWDRVKAEQLPDVDFEVWGDCLSWTEEELCHRLRGVTAVVTGRKSPLLPQGLIEDAGKLKAVFHCHGGIRGIAGKEHLLAGITVTNWGKDSGGSLAEAALALMLGCLKQLRSLHAWVETGKQVDGRIYQNFPCTLYGANIGLYGFGPIGSKMWPLLEPFSPKLAIYDPYAESIPPGAKRCATLEELFDHSDIVSIHCGLNDVTRDSVTADLLDRLPQGGILVNTARGKIVDEDALAERVHAGRLLAGLDVVREEGAAWGSGPMTGTPHAILGGHQTGKGKGPEPDTAEQRSKRLAGHVVKNIRALMNAEPLINEVTADEYDLKT
jgi:phosphoglycerate dehydrogenase-like enzyme